MRTLLIAVIAMTLSACVAVSVERSSEPTVPADRIIAELHASTEAWNEGDLEGFLAPYSEETTYVGSSGMVRGKDELRETYQGNYWASGTPTSELNFSDIEVRPLGSDHALLTGKYLLFDDAGVLTGEGPFTLIYERTDEGWRIIHDHSS